MLDWLTLGPIVLLAAVAASVVFGSGAVGLERAMVLALVVVCFGAVAAVHVWSAWL